MQALPVLLGVAAGSLGLLYLLVRLLKGRWRRQNLPPERSGWIPWLGCALDFGKAPLFFIQETREKLGDIFTVHAAGRRMTFVAHPRDYKQFFHNSNASFDAAVQPFTMKVAGFSTASFCRHHSDLHNAIKGKLVPTYLTKLCPILSGDLYGSFSKLGREGEMELMSFVRHTMFDSVMRQMFGPENVPKTEDGMRELERKFYKFDEGFEYGSQLPEFLIRDWSDCKYWLLSLFKEIVAGARKRGKRGKKSEGDEQLMFEKVMEIADSCAHNCALLFLWALQANAVPVVFWCLAHILSSPSLYETLKEDVKGIDFTSADADVLAESLKSTMSVKRCVLETVRLHAPGMIARKVTETYQISGFDIPAGHYLMLSPYWCNRDREKFPDPETFKPDRWLECNLEKNKFLDGFVGFGGGRHQCPGRWLALMEMHLYVAMALQLFDMQLLGPLPSTSGLHLIGVQQPKDSCLVTYRRQE